MEYPDAFGERKIVPMQGASILPALQGRPINRREPLFWQWAATSAGTHRLGPGSQVKPASQSCSEMQVSSLTHTPRSASPGAQQTNSLPQSPSV